LDKTTRKSINNDLWRDVIDCDLGTIVKIFMKSQATVYIGKLAAREENGLESWFLLADYKCKYVDKNEEFNSKTHPTPTRVMIPLSEVERVELFYDTDTELFSYRL
jgi:hypothetical protein